MKNQFAPSKHNRHSIRLKCYDYSHPGLYFVTISVRKQLHLFGRVENAKMILNSAGKMIKREWLKIPERFPKTNLHEFIVMPNHFHGILEILPRSLDEMKPPYGQTLVVVPSQSGKDSRHEESKGNEESLNVQNKNNSDSKSYLGQPQEFARTGAFDLKELKEIFQNETEKTKVLGDYIGAFESITTVEYIRGVSEFGWERFLKKLWHRNYFEHIIRTPRAYFNISNYIINNPVTWQQDTYFKNCAF